MRLDRGDVWTLEVLDQGPGIAAADLPHVFERFYRADTARALPGSGLGLAIVQQVVTAHGGTVAALSPPGGGTLIRIQLPTVAENEPDSPGFTTFFEPERDAAAAGPAPAMFAPDVDLLEPNPYGEPPSWSPAAPAPAGDGTGLADAPPDDSSAPADTSPDDTWAPADPPSDDNWARPAAPPGSSTGPADAPPADNWAPADTPPDDNWAAADTPPDDNWAADDTSPDDSWAPADALPGSPTGPADAPPGSRTPPADARRADAPPGTSWAPVAPGRPRR